MTEHRTVRAMVSLGVAAAMLAVGQPANAASDKLPWGKTYWEVTDSGGVDCADCGGVRVLARTTKTKARLAHVIYSEAGDTWHLFCETIRKKPNGRWRSADSEFSYSTKANTLTSTSLRLYGGDRVWVRHRQIGRSTAATSIRQAIESGQVDNGDFQSCVR